ncbi:MFS transporter [Streptomyces sp. SS]|uniref:MFS transporter n=1 Tax=Streptomyces sp. SS TaxID=260742 RepID=UPI0002FDC666|nr:MFS transporter [Streptomyces sp. SS]
MVQPARERAQFVLFATGVLLGLVAEQVVMFSVPLLIFQDTENISVLGISFALEWLPGLLAFPFAGLIADRDGGPRLFSRVNAGRAIVLVLVLTVCATLPSATVPALMAGAVFMSLLMAPIRLSVEKAVLLLAKGEKVARTQSLVQNMELLAMAVGPALAVLGSAYIGKLWLLCVAAALCAVAALCWLPLPRGERQLNPGSVAKTVGELRLGWSLLIHNRPVVLLVSINFSINLAFATALSVNAAVVTDIFKAPESSFALLNTLNLMLVPTLLKRFEVKALGVFGFVLLSTSLLGLASAPSFVLYTVAYVAALMGVAYFNVYNRTQRVKVIPSSHLGKVMGPFYLLNTLSYPIGGLLIAFLGNSLGPQLLVGILAVLLALYGLVVLPLTIRGFNSAIAALEQERLLADVQGG